jgi:hypothetical protein
MAEESGTQGKEANQPETAEERFYSLVLQRQLTWGVIVLTFLAGILGLLPLLTSESILGLFLAFIYFILCVGLSYSIYYLGKLFEGIHVYIEPAFKESRIGDYLKRIRGVHTRLLWNPNVSKSIAVVSFFVWTTAGSIKLFFSKVPAPTFLLVYNQTVTLSWELLATFLGVFAAFSLDRLIDWIKNFRSREDLKRDLRNELEEIRGKLTGRGLRLYPDIWDSAISSGQIRLLNSEQVRKLRNVYDLVKGTDYEAMRVRDAAIDFEKAKAGQQKDTSLWEQRWAEYSQHGIQREKELRAMIENILKEDWLNS